MKRKIDVIADFDFLDSPKHLGTMTIDSSNFKSVISFSFDSEWINNSRTFNLGFQSLIPQTPGLEENFGFLLDSSPDRWGRLLIERFNDSSRSFREHDYLLAIDDYLRSGAIRFKEDEQYLGSGESSIPPMESLGKLEQLCGDYQSNNINAETRILVNPGSSLGGARPKANIIDNEGSLWIAKFPSNKDIHDVGLWESLVNRAARNCGIDVPDTKTIKSNMSNNHVFLSRRFDRKAGKRIHICSVYNLLGLTTNSDQSSFFDILEAIEKLSFRPREDKEELYKRLVFSCICNNTDNHLRNHSMLLSSQGWCLSPAYDINISTDSDKSVLSVDFNSHQFRKEAIIDVAPYYGVKKEQANNLFLSMRVQLSLIRDWAAGAGISKTEIDAVMSCTQV